MRHWFAVYGDDAAYALGLALIGVGVFRLSTTAAIFYAGFVSLGVGALLTLARRGR